jgi:glucose-1-phosphate cytidylyltransferase
MDTLRDKQTLQDLWASGEAPWKVWDRDPRPLLHAVEGVA